MPKGPLSAAPECRTCNTRPLEFDDSASPFPASLLSSLHFRIPAQRHNSTFFSEPCETFSCELNDSPFFFSGSLASDAGPAAQITTKHQLERRQLGCPASCRRGHSSRHHQERTKEEHRLQGLANRHFFWASHLRLITWELTSMGELSLKTGERLVKTIQCWFNLVSLPSS